MIRAVRTGAAMALAVALLSGCASLRQAGDSWWGDDKAKHFAVCGLAGAAGALAARQADGSDGQAFGIGVGVAVGLGVGVTLGVVVAAGYAPGTVSATPVSAACWRMSARTMASRSPE